MNAGSGAVAADVVVIGAGLAGLRCAHDLRVAGREVVVLESRQRVGGRVHSHRFADGQWCERGAEFVDTAHCEVLALAAQLGLEFTPVRAGKDDAARLLDVGGRAVPLEHQQRAREGLARWEAAMADLADRVGEFDDAGLAALDHLDDTASADLLALDLVPLADVLAGLGLDVHARVLVGRIIRTEYMVAPDQVSAVMAGWMERLHRISGDGFEALRIAGGNDRLATGLADLVGAERIELGTRVVSVDERDGVVLTADGRRYCGSTVVAAVPLPVLARMWPAMPAELGRVGYGIGGKISVQVARRVWRDFGRDGSVLSERAWGELWETTDGQPGDRGVLTALLSSADGAALVALPDAVARVIAEMDRIFPGVRGLAGEHVVTDWTHDPDSLGAYAVFGPGVTAAAQTAMRRRYDRLLLAGEHTDLWSGYMEGALRSGARAAARIVAGDQASDPATSRPVVSTDE